MTNNLNSIRESDCQARRRSRLHLLSREVAENFSSDRIIDESDESRQVLDSRCRTLLRVLATIEQFIRMHKSTRTGLIGLAVLVCLVFVIFILHLVIIKSSQKDKCVKLDGSETCLSKNPNPYRYYGTKTSYHVAIENNTDLDIPVGNCTPKVFYLLSRHATRYPDKEWIVPIINILPPLKEKIINSCLSDKANFCDEDLKRLKNWTVTMSKKNDNKLSETGEMEAEELAQRLKDKFSSILKQRYSPDTFQFEYTSRERTRSTAEAFAKGLFGDKYMDIDIDGKSNEDLLAFHKICKDLQKKCPDTSYDISEVQKFKNGPLMKKVVDSVSQRVGFTLSSDEVRLIYTACVFGYALDDDDIWCSLFSTDELKVMEFDSDIDDYYKDAYGNKINYEQACPVAKFIVDLFKSSENSSDSKVILHFSHAGGIKKVYPFFGLFRDKTPLTADDFCSQADRKWRSSLISPFNTNIAFVLYQCDDEYKVATFHNEKSVRIKGCSSNLCCLKEFYETYEPIADRCNLNKICCTCCSD